MESIFKEIKIKKPPVSVSGIKPDEVYKRIWDLECIMEELLQNCRICETEHIRFVQLIEDIKPAIR